MNDDGYSSSSESSPIAERPNGLPGREFVSQMLATLPQQNEQDGPSTTKKAESPEITNEMSSLNFIDETPTYSHQSQTQSPQIQERFESQDIELYIQINECLDRLEEARKGIEDHTQRLEDHLKKRQEEDRKQKLRERRHRRQRKEQARQIQTHLRGLGLRFPDEIILPNSMLGPKTAAGAGIKKAKRGPHPDFPDKIAQMRHKLHPLVSYTTGLPHPDFPNSVLSYNLLTSTQLDSLAVHFHQTYPPKRESFRYPLPVKPWLATNGFIRDLGVDVEVKRRRFGRFIGLRGCESPVKTKMGGDEEESQVETIAEQVGKDWERRYRVAKAAERRGSVVGQVMFM